MLPACVKICIEYSRAICLAHGWRTVCGVFFDDSLTLLGGCFVSISSLSIYVPSEIIGCQPIYLANSISRTEITSHAFPFFSQELFARASPFVYYFPKDTTIACDGKAMGAHSGTKKNGNTEFRIDMPVRFSNVILINRFQSERLHLPYRR
jgi:hypothetical protein